MFLKELTVSGFRNLRPQKIGFNKQVTVISGQNGQGKTSLLEAIYLLSHNRSFRPGKLRDVISWDIIQTKRAVESAISLPAAENLATVEATLRGEDGEREIKIAIRPSSREVSVNGKTVKQFKDFFGQLKTVAFTPETLQLVKGPPQFRRSFLDRILAMVDPVFVDASLHYHRALKNRNIVLNSNKLDELSLWDELLATYGAEVCQRRAELSSWIAERVGRAYQEVSAGAEEQVALDYESDFLGEKGRGLNKQILSNADIQAELVGRLDRDRRLKTTSFGVHRDELEISITVKSSSHDARLVASQGQARSIALALNFAAIDYLAERSGEPPLILLDDVESELDNSRRAALLAHVAAGKNQVLITSTDASNYTAKNLNSGLPLDVSLMQVADGELSS